MSFAIWFDDICMLPAREVLERVRKSEKAPLGELRVYDLLRQGDRHLLWGVYIFYSGEQCLYVGKNSAQKFVERIPAHLSLSEDSWMNHLVKRIRHHEQLDCLATAADAAREYALLLIPVGQKEPIGPLEKFFRLFVGPKYNSFPEPHRARYAHLDLDLPLTEVLRHL